MCGVRLVSEPGHDGGQRDLMSRIFKVKLKSALELNPLRFSAQSTRERLVSLCL